MVLKTAKEWADTIHYNLIDLNSSFIIIIMHQFYLIRSIEHFRVKRRVVPKNNERIHGINAMHIGIP